MNKFAFIAMPADLSFPRGRTARARPGVRAAAGGYR